MTPFVLTFRVNDYDTYHTWLFDTEADLRDAVALLESYGEHFDVLYVTENAGKGDFICDLGEFRGVIETTVADLVGDTDEEDEE